MTWGCPAYYAAVTANPCAGCNNERRAICQHAVRAGLTILCEDQATRPRPALRNYHQHLQPGDTFTPGQLAARAGATKHAVQTWCYAATKTGVLSLVTRIPPGPEPPAQPRSWTPLYRYHPGIAP